MRARLAVIALAAAACGSDPRPGPTAQPAVAPVPAPPLRTQPEPPLDEASIYDLELRLVDQAGAEIALSAGRGHPVVIAMFYGSCTTACPRLIEDLREVEDALTPAQRERTRILMVSFDAARDTPAALTTLARERGLDPARWTLAAAGDGDARLLAAVLGIRFRPLDGGDFAHSSVLTVLDAGGRPLARLEGLAGDNAALAARVP